jgi:hypothetical protein
MDQEMDDRVVRPLRVTRRLALMNGWTIEQADSLVAWRDGLSASQHWTLRQVCEVEFLRWLREHGRADG